MGHLKAAKKFYTEGQPETSLSRHQSYQKIKAKEYILKNQLKETPLATITLSLNRWGNLLVDYTSVDNEEVRKELDKVSEEDGYENSHVIAGAIRLMEETFNKINEDMSNYIKAV